MPYSTNVARLVATLIPIYENPVSYTYADEVSTSLATLSGHSGPINQVLLSLPIALSASGPSIR